MSASEIRYSLADIRDPDLRAKDPVAMRLAAEVTIPHPLRNVQYADGMKPCTHAKRHERFEFCPWGEDR